MVRNGTGVGALAGFPWTWTPPLGGEFDARYDGPAYRAASPDRATEVRG